MENIMADKIPSTLSQSVITTLVSALADGIVSARNSGKALLQFCNAAAKAKLPKTPNESDVVALTDALSAKLGWNGTPREKVSKSETRNIIRQHAFIPELQTALIASPYGVCGYHDTVKLCRLMKSEGSIGAAVKAFNTVKAGKAADTAKRFELALQAHYQTVSESKSSKKSAQLAALRQVAQAFGFEPVKE
jgi:hypothetical protein